MRAVDTSLLVRLLMRDDAKQALAADSLVAAGAWLSHVVLAELEYVLDSTYGLKPAQLNTVVEMLLKHEQLTIQDANVVEAAQGLFRSGSADFSDCLVLATAREVGHLPLGTFDRVYPDLKVPSWSAERAAQPPESS
jgi:predicted nucleic-acid-binding protein